MGKLACFTIAMLVATCQSVLAETVFYCVPKNIIGVHTGGTSIYKHDRFTMKISGDLVNGRVVQIEGAYLFNLNALVNDFKVTEYGDDQMWQAINLATQVNLASRILYFEYPNLIASIVRRGQGGLLHATCETF